MVTAISIREIKLSLSSLVFLSCSVSNGEGESDASPAVDFVSHFCVSAAGVRSQALIPGLHKLGMEL